MWLIRTEACVQILTSVLEGSPTTPALFYSLFFLFETVSGSPSWSETLYVAELTVNFSFPREAMLCILCMLRCAWGGQGTTLWSQLFIPPLCRLQGQMQVTRLDQVPLFIFLVHSPLFSVGEWAGMQLRSCQLHRPGDFPGHLGEPSSQNILKRGCGRECSSDGRELVTHVWFCSPAPHKTGGNGTPVVLAFEN